MTIIVMDLFSLISSSYQIGKKFFFLNGIGLLSFPPKKVQ